jgi:O-6-methylguanine DNA methyltransferase
LTVSKFAARVYELTSKVPEGKVTTYGAIARKMGRPKASRAVGAALRANPTPIVVPCHRVVGFDGSLRGYGGGSGIPTKAKLLRKEGVSVSEGRVDLSRFLFSGL